MDHSPTFVLPGHFPEVSNQVSVLKNLHSHRIHDAQGKFAGISTTSREKTWESWCTELSESILRLESMRLVQRL